MRGAVDQHERPGRIAVDDDVRPDVDARDEQQRVLRVERDAMVMGDVEAEARAVPIDAELRGEPDEEAEDALAGDLTSGG